VRELATAPLGELVNGSRAGEKEEWADSPQ
jgi:hypothetical protein